MPPSSPGLLPCGSGSVSKCLFSYNDTGHPGLEPALIPFDLILTQLHLQRPRCQVKSRSRAPGRQEFGCTTNSKGKIALMSHVPRAGLISSLGCLGETNQWFFILMWAPHSMPSPLRSPFSSLPVSLSRVSGCAIIVQFQPNSMHSDGNHVSCLLHVRGASFHIPLNSHAPQRPDAHPFLLCTRGQDSTTSIA